MLPVHEKWNLCPFVTDASFVTDFVLFGVSMLTMVAISVDRLLALSLGLRYRQIVALKRMYYSYLLDNIHSCFIIL